MSAPRCEALDWMKASGISLIVYGHVAHKTTVAWVPPIYVKQFGVAFFLFAAGFTLARDPRRPMEAILSRLLPVYVFGLATAATITLLGSLTGSGLALSNYLPFFAGANVAFNNFPANPTTWYLGTYIHALALWACWLSRYRLGAGAIVLALLVEMAARPLLLEWAGPYVAYMALTNWLAVFVAGLVFGGRPSLDTAGRAPAYLAALAVVTLALSLAAAAFSPTPSFPFMTFGSSPARLAIFSALVSTFYLAATLLTFKAAERITAPWPVRALARNSLLIVLLHMPLFMLINPRLSGWGWSYPARVALELVVCLPLLAWFSGQVTAAVSPKALVSRLAGVSARAGRAVEQPAPFAGSR